MQLFSGTPDMSQWGAAPAAAPAPAAGFDLIGGAPAGGNLMGGGECTSNLQHSVSFRDSSDDLWWLQPPAAV